MVIINNLVHSIIDLWQKQSFVTIAQKNLQQEQQKNQLLQHQLKTVSQQNFIEQQARDKLLLVKPGEQLVLIPSELIPSPIQLPKPKDTKKVAHWKEWIDYLFLSQ